VFEAAFEREPVHDSRLRRMGWMPKSHTDHEPRSTRTEEREILVFFADED
jgi:hypothetical protein